jgi:hypothetical protein
MNMLTFILIASTLAVFIAGYFLIRRMDHFLDQADKWPAQEYAMKEPDCVVIRGDQPTAKIDEEINDFRKTHSDYCVVLYDQSIKESRKRLHRHARKEFSFL